LFFGAASVPGCSGAGKGIPNTPESNGLPALQTPAEPAPALAGLPLPSVLAGQLPGAAGSRTASYVPADLLKEAETFEAELPHQRMSATATGAAFDPNWRRATPDPADLAYAMYSFDVPGYGTTPAVHQLDRRSAGLGRRVVALANWGEDRWDWYGMASDGTCALARNRAVRRLRRRPAGRIVLIDANPCELDWLRLGSPANPA
jgi:hypothetical protein